MRYLWSAILFICLSTPIHAFAKTVDVESKITKATIYSDRATLTRQAVIDIPAGKHKLIFSGLPLSIYTDSLRVSGEAQADIVFGAVSHKRQSFEEYVVPREQELNTKLIAFKDKKKALQAEKQALKAGRTFLESLGEQASLRTNEEIAEINLNPEGWGNAVDSITEKMEQNLKASLEIDTKLRDIKNQITATQNDLNQLRTGQKQSYNVEVPYESNVETTLTVELRYQLPNVGWRPVYEARLNTKSSEMELIQYASVWQQTGEDWTDIALTLSTAQPSRGTSLPDLNTHWVNLMPKMRKMQGNYMSHDAISASSKVLGASEMVQEEMMLEREVSPSFAAAPAMKTARSREAAINTEGLIAEYEIAGLSNVKSDGTRTKVLIGSFETKTHLQVQIKPQMQNQAYLVAKTTLQGEAPVLPGQVSLFRDGSFLGKGYIPMLRPGDDQNLGFGVDDNVTVTRNMIKDERSEAGLISKEKTLERHYVTEIQNLHQTDVEIAVLETIPVSKDERIRVNIAPNETTAGYEQDVNDVKGVLRWVNTLKSQEKSKIKLGWTAAWPAAENVSGL